MSNPCVDEVADIDETENFDDMPELELRETQENSSEKNEISSKKGKNAEKSIEHPEEQKLPSKVPVDEWLDVLGNGKLMRKIIKHGMGRDSRPENGSLVSLRTRGQLDDGSEIDCNENISFTLGDGDVINAWDLGVALMELHEISLIKTNHAYAYGLYGRPNDIPPKTEITYEMELLRVEPPVVISDLSLTDRIKLGNQKRERGNYLYGRNEHTGAVNSYNKALRFLDDGTLPDYSDSEKQLVHEIMDLQRKCYNNMAAAQLKIRAHDAAILSCEAVLRSEPDNVKALFRKGKAYVAKNQIGEAIECFRTAIKIDPSSKIVQQELKRLIEKQRVNEKGERELYRRMLGENTSQKKKPSWFSNKWTYVGGLAFAVTSAVVGYLISQQRSSLLTS